MPTFDASGWTGYFSITSKHAAISAACPNVIIDFSLIPADSPWWSVVASDGSDVRIVDASSHERDFLFIEFNKSASTGWAVVHADGALSASVDKTWKIYAGNSFAVFPTYAPFSSDPDVVAYLNLGNDPASAIPDLTGHGNDAVSSGAMSSGSVVAGKIGKGLQFDGSDDYLTVPGNVIDNNLTFRASVKPASSTSGIKVVMDCRTGNAQFSGPVFFAYDGYWSYLYRDQGPLTSNWAIPVRQYVPIVADEWYDLAITYSDSGAKFYINGDLIQEDDATPPLDYSFNAAWRIGGDTDAFYFDGLINSVAIYSRELSAAEIATIFANENSADGIWTAGMWTGPSANTLFRRTLSSRTGSRSLSSCN